MVDGKKNNTRLEPMTLWVKTNKDLGLYPLRHETMIYLDMYALA